MLRLNFRDHGGTHALNRELFHSCRLPEVVGAVARVQALFPEHRLLLAGFSLGGNFCLRVGARARAAGIRIARIVAVCPVLDPATTLVALEQRARDLPALLSPQVAAVAAAQAVGLAGPL